MIALFSRPARQAVAAGALVATLVAAGGCAVQNAYLRADAAELELAAGDVAQHTITIDASSSWALYTGTTFLWLSATYDADDASALRVRALGVNESREELRDTLLIVSADALTLTIPVVQRALAGSLAVTPAAPEPFGPRESETRTLTVETNLSAWEHTVLGDGWLTATRADGGREITLRAKGLNRLEERRDTVVVYPVAEDFSQLADSIPVVQRGMDLVMTAEAMNAETFDVAIPAAGGEVAVSIYSRAAWTLAHDADPERVSVNLTEGGADTENGVPLIVTVAANLSTEEYTFTVTFTSDGKKYTYLCRQPAVPQQ
jgi:hypothetical protein